MGFGGQMHHRARPMLGEDARERRGVANIGLLEDMPRIVTRRAKRFQIAGIGQLVEIDDGFAGLGNKLANNRRSNKTGAAGDDKSHVFFRCCAVDGGSIQGWSLTSRESGDINAHRADLIQR
jgi:hypothetical protein